jgi:lactoylglutathione lyase
MCSCENSKPRLGKAGPIPSQNDGLGPNAPAYGMAVKKCLLLTVCSLFTASVGISSETNRETIRPNQKTMTTSSVSLGYVMLYVKDVSASLTFYEKAFGLARRFFQEAKGKAYGELETGACRLAFASLAMAKDQLKQPILPASPDKMPLGFEIALVTTDVQALYDRAVKAGATVVSAPEAKPWGQTVACLRDRDGYLVELCTPLP